jgi:hypothetical protein
MADFKKLSAPFPPNKVSWRIGQKTKDGRKAMALAYIDARDVMARLDEVCGPGGWQASYPHANGKTVCSIGIKHGDEWIWKANGAGDTDIEAEKGALSDAFKRAAVMWGVGRYLYDVASVWVETEGDGKFAKIARHEYDRLRAVLPGAMVEGEDEPDPAAAREYVDVALGILETLNTPEAVKGWWDDEKTIRHNFGIVKPTPEYERLFAALVARGNALRAAA